MSDTTSSASATLTEKLADLLGFEDGAQDVLEHLLSIESSEDLRAYLSQLLGQDGENIRLFVEDVGKFQRGESLSSAPSISQRSVKKTADESGSARKRQENYMEGVKRNDKVQERKIQLNNRKPAPKSSTPSVGAAKSHTPPPPKMNTTAKKPVPPQAVKEAPTSTQVDIVDTKITPPTQPRLPIAPPPKGVASRVCGCYGTIHKPLTNCLYCGRISCADEGYDFCGFCGFLVSPPAADGGGSAAIRAGSNSESWLLKERLLRFDREFVRRTEVVDDQEDYYANSTSTWLTEEERHNAQDKADDRQQELNQSGKKQVLNLQF